MGEAAEVISIRPLGEPGDLGWAVMAHGEVYAAEFGWDASFEGLVAQIVAEYASRTDRARNAAWIAELGGRRVGCVFCMASAEPGMAHLRILLVDPVGRGHSLGSSLVGIAIEFARAAGYARMRLWTNHPLAAARHIYLRHGFALIGEKSHRSFGADLIGQTYELDLVAGSGEGRDAGELAAQDQ
jgi:GNAT superfamily N-acetyltransferase